MNRGLKILIYFIFLGPSGMSNLIAQNDDRISCVALVKEDSIILRWAPASSQVWQEGIKHGYIIKKYTILRNGEYQERGLKNSELLTGIPVRPKSIEYFDALSSTDSSAAILREIIYTPGPLADTGNFTSVIKASEEMETRMGFALFICDMSPVLARASGLMFTDKNIGKGDRYVYSISLADTPENIKVEPAVIVIDAGEMTVLPQVEDIMAIFSDRAVKFRWPITFYKGIYSAYILEKSIDGRNFSPVSELPLVNLSADENQYYFHYTDSLLTNNQQVMYRVSGISPFGEKGLPSKTIIGKGVPDFSAYAVIDTAIIEKEMNVRITWRLSEESTAPVSEINILRANNYNGPYEQLNKKPLNPKIRSFSDENPIQSNYYQVMLTSKDNLSSYSFPYFVQTEDNDPPKVPQMLSGSIDANGNVILTWKRNVEPDLLGYKLFRSNSLKGDFISLDREISPENQCIDSVNLNTLSRNVFYQVVAIDKNYNSSDYSGTLKLIRPDTIAPSPAIITRTDYKSGKVTIQFESSPSEDVSSFELQRQPEDDTIVIVRSWEKILPDKFEDRPLIAGKILKYTLSTIDSSGNRSSVDHKIYIPEKTSQTINSTIEQSDDGKTITLHWIIPEEFHPEKTNIYRSSGEEQMSLYASKQSPEPFFEDKDTRISTIYNYMIVLYSKDGFLRSDKLVFNPSRKK